MQRLDLLSLVTWRERWQSVVTGETSVRGFDKCGRREETLWPLFTKLALGEHGTGRASMQLTRGSCTSPHL